VAQGQLHPAVAAVGDHGIDQREERVERDERLDPRVRRNPQAPGGDLPADEPDHDEHVVVGQRVESGLDEGAQVSYLPTAVGDRSTGRGVHDHVGELSWTRREGRMAGVHHDSPERMLRVQRVRVLDHGDLEFRSDRLIL
jgi:hypothetical protein